MDQITLNDTNTQDNLSKLPTLNDQITFQQQPPKHQPTEKDKLLQKQIAEANKYNVKKRSKIPKPLTQRETSSEHKQIPSSHFHATSQSPSHTLPKSTRNIPIKLPKPLTAFESEPIKETKYEPNKTGPNKKKKVTFDNDNNNNNQQLDAKHQYLSSRTKSYSGINSAFNPQQPNDNNNKQSISGTSRPQSYVAFNAYSNGKPKPKSGINGIESSGGSTISGYHSIKEDEFGLNKGNILPWQRYEKYSKSHMPNMTYSGHKKKMIHDDEGNDVIPSSELYGANVSTFSLKNEDEPKKRYYDMSSKDFFSVNRNRYFDEARDKEGDGERLKYKTQQSTPSSRKIQAIYGQSGGNLLQMTKNYYNTNESEEKKNEIEDESDNSDEEVIEDNNKVINEDNKDNEIEHDEKSIDNNDIVSEDNNEGNKNEEQLLKDNNNGGNAENVDNENAENDNKNEDSYVHNEDNNNKDEYDNNVSNDDKEKIKENKSILSDDNDNEQLFNKNNNDLSLNEDNNQLEENKEYSQDKDNIIDNDNEHNEQSQENKEDNENKEDKDISKEENENQSHKDNEDINEHSSNNENDNSNEQQSISNEDNEEQPNEDENEIQDIKPEETKQTEPSPIHNSTPYKTASTEKLSLISSLCQNLTNEKKIEVNPHDSIWSVLYVPSFNNTKDAIITGHSSGNINVFDIEFGKQQKSFNEHTSKVYFLKSIENKSSNSSFKTHFVSISEDRTIKIWNAFLQNSILSISSTSPIFSLDLINNSCLIVGDKSKNISIHHFNLSSDDETRRTYSITQETPHESFIWRLLSLKKVEDPKYIVSSSEGSLMLHKFADDDLRELEHCHTFNKAHKGLIHDIEELSPGKFATCGGDNEIKIWDHLHNEPISVIDMLYNSTIYDITYLNDYEKEACGLTGDDIIICGGYDKTMKIIGKDKNDYEKEPVVYADYPRKEALYKIRVLTNNPTYKYAAINCGCSSTIYLWGKKTE